MIARGKTAHLGITRLRRLQSGSRFKRRGGSNVQDTERHCFRSSRGKQTRQFLAATSRRRLGKRAVIGAAALLATAAVVYFGYDYWTTGRFEVATDDAYVQADFTTVAPKVSGYLNQVLVVDNQPVKAGQVLARIDDRDFRTALDQATAEVVAAKAAIDNLDAQPTLQQSVIDQAKGQPLWLPRLPFVSPRPAIRN